MDADSFATAKIGSATQNALPAPVERVASVGCRKSATEERRRGVPEETPIALTFNGTTYAVMMATPADLTDFAVGFSLAEGVIASPSDIERLSIVTHAAGIELQMWLSPARASALSERRRSLAGPTGCGLCGVESLDALPRIPCVGDGIVISPQTVFAAMSSLQAAQPLFRETRAVHAAGLYVPGKDFVSVREDVGRHNALDKLAGDLARRNISGVAGLVAVTGRISIEIVQKTAALGASIIVAVSAPTALAIRSAEASGLTLIAIARDDEFEIFTGPQRISASGNHN